MSGGLAAATNGFGVNIATTLSSSHACFQKGVKLDFQTLRTLNETKVSNPYTTNPKPYVLGKVNTASTIRLSYVLNKRLGSYIANQPNLLAGISIGPSIAILKPYYIGYFDPLAEDRQAQIIVQNKETLENQNNIYGPANWTNGLSELNYDLGLHMDVHLAATLAEGYTQQQWNTGVRADLFPGGLNILYNIKTRSFYSVYISYNIGSKP